LTLNGFDIANVNGPGIITQALGGDFVICKTSEGLGFRDPYADQWAGQARAAGKPVGKYHFAHLTNDPTAEADFFISCANLLLGDTAWLDFEPYGQPVSDAVFPSWIITFVDRVNARTGGNCGGYFNDDMARRVLQQCSPAQAARIRQIPMWKASYSYNPASGPGNTWGFQSVVMHQWGDRGIDSDIFYGTRADWLALGGLGTSVFTADAATITPQQEEDMLVLSQATRGIWLVGCNYSHNFSGEEWSTYYAQRVATGQVKAILLPDTTQGVRDFDVLRAAHTQPAHV
jgi:lysozyme